MKKIALEEHFMWPGVSEYWGRTVKDVPAPVRDKLVASLSDFGEARLAAMDRSDLEIAVLSVAGPGIQIEPDTAIAVRKAKECNDFLAGKIAESRGRYRGFAHVALQDPKEAANELERSVRELGFCGAMIHGPSTGHYLDEEAFFPFWERAEALGVIVYLHPGDPAQPNATLKGYPALERATWGWGVETGSHALRVVFSGLFERFPKAKLALGHLGETLPFLLWRFDSRAKLYAAKLPKPPSAYIRENIVVTCSGMYSLEPLRCTIDALGIDNVMFSADYPFESLEEAAKFIDEVPLSETERRAICFANAERILRIKR